MIGLPELGGPAPVMQLAVASVSYDNEGGA